MGGGVDGGVAVDVAGLDGDGCLLVRGVCKWWEGEFVGGEVRG